MREVRRSKQTIRDLAAILSYIATDNAPAAERWLETIEELFVLMASHPGMGEVVSTPRLGNLRRRSFGHYVIYFRDRDYGVFIARVLHGARDHRRLT
ncbi:MAG: type II toxin-antitoxin system RelE/ParE family toxin [Pirellulales bacterium]